MGSGDQALFRESDNLESVYARAALRRFYIALWRGNIPGWSLDRFEDATGLKLVHEGNLKEDLPPMPRFLNRLLALPIDEQNQLFAELEARIAENIEQAIEAGSFEVGVESVRGRFARHRRPGDPLRASPHGRGHRAGRDRPPRQAGTARCRYRARARRPRARCRQPAPDWVRTSRSWPSTPARSAPPSCCRRPRACSTTAACRNASASSARQPARPWRRAELDASNWRRADEARWRAIWEHEIAELPSHRESRFWLAAGLLLPVWDRLPAENMRVRRLATDTGESLIGRVLDAEQVAAVRTSPSASTAPSP